MKKPTDNNVKNLSHINTAKDLQMEILKVRLRIQTNKTTLLKNFKEVPKESLKLIADKILPAFLKNRFFK